VILLLAVVTTVSLCPCVKSFAWGDEKDVDELIDQLKADMTFGNARDARSRLLRMLNSQGATLKPSPRAVARTLEQALLSEDYQQRHNAASLLRRTSGYKPGKNLLAVTIEGLRDDSVPHPPPRGRRRLLAGVFGNASEGTEYLAAHVAGCADLLKAALESDCEQQRTLCAAILATEADAAEMERYGEVFRRGLTSPSEQQRFLSAYLMGVFCIRADMEEVTGILAEHLKSNGIPWDAKLATQALSHLGVAAHLYLDTSGSTDAQQQRRMASIRQHLVSQPIANRKTIPGYLRFIWSFRYLWEEKWYGR